MSHANHPEFTLRLRRASGHLNRVISMVEGGQDCIAIAQQLQAVIKALEASKRSLIHHHIDEHLGLVGGGTEAGTPARTLVDEIKELSKYL